MLLVYIFLHFSAYLIKKPAIADLPGSFYNPNLSHISPLISFIYFFFLFVCHP